MCISKAVFALCAWRIPIAKQEIHHEAIEADMIPLAQHLILRRVDMLNLLKMR